MHHLIPINLGRPERLVKEIGWWLCLEANDEACSFVSERTGGLRKIPAGCHVVSTSLCCSSARAHNLIHGKNRIVQTDQTSLLQFISGGL